MWFQILLVCFVGITLNLVEQSEPKRRGRGISSNVFQKLKNIKNTTAFIEKFLKKKTLRSLPANEEERKAQEVENYLFTRQGNVNPGGASQVSGMIAKNDACEPKMTSVKITQSDPSVLLWPTCTKLHRCAGCCGSSIFACTPTKKVKVSLQVMVCKPSEPGSDDFNVVGIKVMDFEEHLDCRCECKTKLSDCDLRKHDYIPHECSCRCKNQQEAGKCQPPKKWDSESCGCVCKNVYMCHPDETFSHSACRCEMKSNQRSTSGSSSSRDPCATYPNCGTGYRKQPYMGRCRCVVSNSMPIAEGRNRRRRPGK